MLTANGIVIRPHEADDIAPMFAAVVESMATVGRWMSWCHPDYSMQDATTWYERAAHAWTIEGDREFGIFDATSGQVLGCVGINQVNRVNLFANLGLARIEIVVLPDNAGSRRVAEKIGARFECIARSRLQFKGETRDAAVYSLVRDDAAR